MKNSLMPTAEMTSEHPIRTITETAGRHSFRPTPGMLNEYQKAAITDTSRAVIVNACVGSGKTTVLTEKVGWLHEQQKIPYEQMMVLTFTNKAADEIRERLGMDAPYFGTFHKAALQLLKEELPPEAEEITVIEPEEELALAEELIASHKLKIKYKNRLKKRLEQEKSAWLSGGCSRYKDDLFLLYPLLSEAKRSRNQLSFDDLLDQCISLLQRKKREGHPFYPSWLIVDEVQDCNRMQVQMLQELCGPDTGFFAVGDPNQMIYGFRGSDGSLFYRIRDIFRAKELTLPVNYRSDPAILQVANRLRQYGDRVVSEKDAIFAHKSVTGEVEASPHMVHSGSEETTGRIPVHNYYDPFQEAQLLAERILTLHENGIPYSEIAVLFRLQEQAEILEKTFSQYEIPVEEVNLLTLHASKGLEFDIVFIIGLNQGLIPINSKDEASREEEQRLLFVGMTRARKQLELSWYTIPGRPPATGVPSPFLKMIPERFLDMDRPLTQEEKQKHLQDLRRMVQLEQKEKVEKADHRGNCDDRQNSGLAGASEKTGKVTGLAEKRMQTEEKDDNKLTSVKYASHPRYGRGKITAEDDIMVTVEFEGYGSKEFIKNIAEYPHLL